MRARITGTKKTILIYGLSNEQQLELEKITTAAGVVCRAVTNAQLNSKIAQLLDDPEHVATQECEPLEGKFAILAGFGSNTDEGTDLINQVDSSVIKAVRTAHNGAWKFRDLCKAIHEEYTVMHGAKENPNVKKEAQ